MACMLLWLDGMLCCVVRFVRMVFADTNTGEN